jgi:16S rRNA C1402 N4-methylase RsmH
LTCVWIGVNPVTAADLIARLSEEQLADILYYYGEERQARRIARFLVKAREEEPVATTGRLAAVVAAAVPGNTIRPGCMSLPKPFRPSNRRER